MSVKNGLSPTAATDCFDNLNHQVMDSLTAELEKTFLCRKKIVGDADVEQLQRLLEDFDIPQQGIDAEAFVRQLEASVVEHSINTGSPYFIGHMTALLPNFIRSLARLKTTLNQNMVKLETAHAATFFERQALAMLHRQFYRLPDVDYRRQMFEPAKTFGVVTSGGTVANLTALQCARASALKPFGDVERLGVHEVLGRAGLVHSVVIVSALGHYSIKKNLGLLGLGKNQLVTIPVDQSQRIDLVALERELERCRRERIHVCALVGVAGSTECGSFDPLEPMAELAARFGCWFHVDAAWGGALTFSPRYCHLLKGIALADSITVDGHKQLYLPMGLGLVLFKDPDAASAIANEANYIIRRESHDLGRISVEGSRAANVFYLQAGLRLLGKSGYGAILERNIATAKAMAQHIDDAQAFELLSWPQSNIFLYRYLPRHYRDNQPLTRQDNEHIDEVNVRLQETQKRAGHSFVSRTRFFDGKRQLTALRVVIANPLTRLEHCLEVLEEQRLIAKALMAEGDLGH